MEEITCPKCSGTMNLQQRGEVEIYRCVDCSGIFLQRADLGALTESENDWHRGAGQHTEPLPRITANMTAPPPSPPRARSYIETLFS